MQRKKKNFWNVFTSMTSSLQVYGTTVDNKQTWIFYSRGTTLRETFGDALFKLKSLCELCWLSLLNVRPLQRNKKEILLKFLVTQSIACNL